MLLIRATSLFKENSQRAEAKEGQREEANQIVSILIRNDSVLVVFTIVSLKGSTKELTRIVFIKDFRVEDLSVKKLRKVRINVTDQIIGFRTSLSLNTSVRHLNVEERQKKKSS